MLYTLWIYTGRQKKFLFSVCTYPKNTCAYFKYSETCSLFFFCSCIYFCLSIYPKGTDSNTENKHIHTYIHNTYFTQQIYFRTEKRINISHFDKVDLIWLKFVYGLLLFISLNIKTKNSIYLCICVSHIYTEIYIMLN